MDTLEGTYSLLIPYLTPLLSLVRTTTVFSRNTLLPFLLPPLNRLLLYLHSSPQAVSFGIVVVILLVAFQILVFLRRMVLFWTRLVLRLAFWGVVVVLGCVLWERGLQRSWEDVSAWTAELAEVWTREYGRWERGRGRGSQSVRGNSGWR